MGRAFTPASVLEAVALFGAGYSKEYIRRRFGWSNRAVERILAKWGLRNAAVKPMLLCTLWSGYLGLTLRDLAEVYGVKLADARSQARKYQYEGYLVLDEVDDRVALTDAGLCELGRQLWALLRRLAAWTVASSRLSALGYAPPALSDSLRRACSCIRGLAARAARRSG